MTIYYITFISIVSFSFLAQKFQTQGILKRKTYARTQSIWVWAAAAVLIFFAGFRYNVGSDWYAYYANDHQFFAENLKVDFFEPGWKIIGFIATSVVDKAGAAMFLAAFITIFLYVRTIADRSDNFVLSMIFYFLLSWHGCFNGVRQYLAAAVLFAGHRYIYERKFWKWAVIVAIASLFHVTAIVMIFWYFVATRELDTKQVVMLLAISAILYLSYDRIFDLVSALKDKEIDSESGYASNQVSIFRIIVNWAPVLFYYIFVSKDQKEHYDKELNFYMNMAFLNALLMTVSSNSAYLARVGIYTGCFVLLVWPLMLNRLNIKSRNLMTAIILLCYGAYWFYDIKSHPDLNNFRLIFENV